MSGEQRDGGEADQQQRAAGGRQAIDVRRLQLDRRDEDQTTVDSGERRRGHDDVLAVEAELLVDRLAAHALEQPGRERLADQRWWSQWYISTPLRSTAIMRTSFCTSSRGL